MKLLHLGINNAIPTDKYQGCPFKYKNTYKVTNDEDYLQLGNLPKSVLEVILVLSWPHMGTSKM